jgi:hypothetical protein
MISPFAQRLYSTLLKKFNLSSRLGNFKSSTITKWYSPSAPKYFITVMELGDCFIIRPIIDLNVKKVNEKISSQT